MEFAENRNNMETIITDVPRVNILRNIVRTRRCSFCRSLNHNILRCDDERLENFKNLCLYQKNLFQQAENQTLLFKSWLFDYYLENPESEAIVKAFSVRYCSANTRNTINQTVNHIIDYFYGLYHDLPDLITLENNETNDFIPFPNIFEENINNEDNFDIIAIVDYLSSQNFFENTENYLNNIEIEVNTENIQNTENISNDCNICYESFDNSQFVSLKCNHEFCKECIKSIFKNSYCNIPKCAFCRCTIEKLTCKSNTIKDEIYNQVFSLLSPEPDNQRFRPRSPDFPPPDNERFRPRSPDFPPPDRNL